jgi:GalNAc-alpha-(1->4)-GalNAc-alpha-(1->3)-diNAcBac-PP-undecaprenol alpha-1,4-N-acetyl-D-galactosaminyltransferase
VKLTLVIYSLSGGGAEKALALLARGLQMRGHQVTVVTAKEDGPESYKLDREVSRVSVGVYEHPRALGGILKNNIQYQRRLRNAILSTRPDVVISFMYITNVRVLLALLNVNVPVVVSERADPARFHYGFVWGFLRRVLYPRCACVVSVSKGVDAFFSWLAESKRAVIYNVAPSCPDSDERQDGFIGGGGSSRRRVVSVGRLVRQKGFDMLLDAFSRVAGSYREWDLYILGEGDQRSVLRRLISRKGLSDRVFLPGWVEEPACFLRSADLFVMSSRFEGFPNALLEAMSCGLPAISFDCRSGPSEIIHDGVDGVLVPPENIDALAAAMTRLMGDASERSRLGHNALNIRERFAYERIMDAWDHLITSVAATSHFR